MLRYPLRRRHLGLALAALVSSLSLLALQQLTGKPLVADGAVRPRLFVFLNTDAKSGALETLLQQHLKQLEVTVFGRFGDFEEALAQRRPDAVLGRPLVLRIQEIPIHLQGVRGQSDREPFVLVSTGTPVKGSLSGRVLGVVDMLGRERTEAFIAQLLKTPDIKLKRVTKREDLLPLLQFAAVEAVLIPSGGVKHLTERSRLPLQTRVMDDAQVGLPVVGVLTPEARSLVQQQFATLGPEVNLVLGVERWRAP